MVRQTDEIDRDLSEAYGLPVGVAAKRDPLEQSQAPWSVAISRSPRSRRFYCAFPIPPRSQGLIRGGLV